MAIWTSQRRTESGDKAKIKGYCVYDLILVELKEILALRWNCNFAWLSGRRREGLRAIAEAKTAGYGVHDRIEGDTGPLLEL